MKISDVERVIQYRFSHPGLLVLAMTHRSFSRSNNERLEFLGDSVLGLIQAEHLYRTLPCSESVMAPLKAALVNTDKLYETAMRLGIGQYLVLGRSEECSNGRNKKSILANSIEAIIAAIYLDGGLEAAKTFVLREMR